MSKVFSVEVLLCATAYIVADSAEEAAATAQDRCKAYLDASVGNNTSFGDIDVSGMQFPDLVAEGVEISFSPALTFHGAASVLDKINHADFTADGLECVHDEEEEGEGDADD